MSCTHSHTPTNSPPLSWASALDLLTVSALRSRVGWTPARNNKLGMYSLIFRVLVATPPQYRRNGTAYAAGASMLSVRGVFACMRSVRVQNACGVRWAWRITAGLCHAFPYCCYSNATCALIANPPNSAQLGASPTTHPIYIRVRAIV